MISGIEHGFLVAILCIVALVFALAAWIRPYVACAGLVLALVAMPAFPASGDSSLPYVAFASGLAMVLVAWACRRLAGWESTGDLGFQGRLVLAFAALMAINLPIAIASGVSIPEWLRGVAPLAGLVLVLVLRDSLEVKRIHQLLLLLAVVGTSHALWGIYLFASQRTRITLLDWRFLTGLTVVAGLVWFARLITSQRSREKLSYALLFALCATATLLSLTRGLVIAQAVGILLLAALRVGQCRTVRCYARRLGWTGATVLGLTAALLISGLPGKSVGALVLARAGEESTLAERIEESASALRPASESPIVGRGLGFRYETSGLTSYRGDTVRYVHNSLVYFVMTMGGLGAFLYPLLFLWPAYWVWKNRKRSPPADVLAGAAICLALLVYSLTSAAFRLYHFNIAAAVGFAVSCRPIAKRARYATPSPAPLSLNPY